MAGKGLAVIGWGHSKAEERKTPKGAGKRPKGMPCTSRRRYPSSWDWRQSRAFVGCPDRLSTHGGSCVTMDAWHAFARLHPDQDGDTGDQRQEGGGQLC